MVVGSWYLSVFSSVPAWGSLGWYPATFHWSAQRPARPAVWPQPVTVLDLSVGSPSPPVDHLHLLLLLSPSHDAPQVDNTALPPAGPGRALLLLLTDLLVQPRPPLLPGQQAECGGLSRETARHYCGALGGKNISFIRRASWLTTWSPPPLTTCPGRTTPTTWPTSSLPSPGWSLTGGGRSKWRLESALWVNISLSLI